MRKHIWADGIRLLHLFLNEDEDARIECQLFDYFLSNWDTGAYFYDALSYVWENHSKITRLT
jgi:hypothetical protein